MSGWQFKICLIGDGFVGKTSIRRKYLKGGFKRSYIPTLGVDFAQKALKYEGRHTNLVIWDIAGQVAYRNIRKRYYEGCSGMILVYSVVERQSFDNASKWLVEAHRFIDKLPPLIIVGNKIDLRPSYQQEKDVVSTEEGRVFTERFSEKLNTPAVFLETSALRGTNIDKVFESLVGLMMGKEEPPKRDLTRAATTQVSPTTAFAPVVTPRSSDALREPDTELVSEMTGATKAIEDEKIGLAMSELVKLRSELRRAEQDLENVLRGLESELLNLRNLVHVKKITYEHMQEQIRITRQEWADAYEKYKKVDQRKKSEEIERHRKIQLIKERVEKAERAIKKDVAGLDLTDKST